jgi:DNA-binding response OmpR family regulator
MHNQAVAEPGQIALADQLFAELQVVTRRLRRIQALLSGTVALEEDVELWQRAGEICEEALANCLAAAEAIQAIPARASIDEGRWLTVSPLRLDTVARRAWLGSRELRLARQELGLLEALARAPTRVWTKQELLRTVWGYESTPRTRTVDSHASRLRRKLMLAGAGDAWVINVWGVGYALRRPYVGRPPR